MNLLSINRVKSHVTKQNGLLLGFSTDWYSSLNKCGSHDTTDKLLT